MNTGDLRLAIGFLETDKLLDLGPYKLWIALVKLSRQNIQHQSVFTAPVKRVMQEMGINHHDYDQLRDYTRYLMGTVLEFAVRKDNTPNWHMRQLLGRSGLSDGVLYWEFQDVVLAKLRDPVLYAYIASQAVNQFTSTYQVALYHLFLANFYPKKLPKKISVSLKQLREEILCLKPRQYGEFKQLNAKVLKPALKKINAHTQLNIQAVFYRMGRRVHEVEFQIAMKRLELPKSPASHSMKRKRIQYCWQQDVKIHAVVQNLEALGLNLDAALKQHLESLYQAQGADRLRKELKGILLQTSTGKLRSPGGFLRTRLQNLEVSPVVDAELLSEELETQLMHLMSSELQKWQQRLKMDAFRGYLQSHLDEIQPMVIAICQEKPFLKAALGDLELSLQKTGRYSASQMALLRPHAERLGFHEPDIDVGKVWAKYAPDILSAVKHVIEHDQNFQELRKALGRSPELMLRAKECLYNELCQKSSALLQTAV